MPRSRRPRSLLALVPAILLPIAFGLVFLAQNAPRDWSLHWTQPRTVIASTSSTDFTAVRTPRGYDLVWERPNGSMEFSRMNAVGRPLVPPVPLIGAPEANNQSITLARHGSMDVVVWREDYSNGSRLRAALLRPGVSPRYETLVTGPWSLEHPRAFETSTGVDVVYSWQRGAYNIYLSRIPSVGRPTPPVQLTHVGTYAFNPHAVVDTSGAINMMYMVSCCEGVMRMTFARFSPSGGALGQPQPIELITSVGGGTQAPTPPRWGLDIERQGKGVVAAWADDAGISAASWQDGREVLRPSVLVPGVATSALALATAGKRRELIWQQGFDLGSLLSTVQLNAQLAPTSAPDRVAYHGESDDVPVPISLHGQPAVLWQASPGKSSIIKIEESSFTPTTQSAPNAWARLGLGLANPVGSFAILVLGGFAVGVLIAAANVLLIIALVALYLIVFRTIRGRWKWYAYALAITVVLFALFITMGAPTPPVLFLTDFSSTSGLLALSGTLLFIIWLARTVLRRIDDVYRAGGMAAGAFFFISFLQALVLMQGQIAKI